jgi:hypothetical protein
MPRQLTIEGRYVQGGLTMHPQKDMRTNQPKKDKDGNPVLGNFLALAVPKLIQVNGQWMDNPKIAQYYAEFEAQARESFPHLYSTGQNSHPRFAMKWQDGDGVDSNGKSVADTPGFAGHWIIKCATQLRAPSCYIRNSNGQLQQLTEPEKVIKKGHYVAVAITLDGNGVEPGNAQAVPGLYVTPESVLYVAPGEEIITGIDPNQAFAGVQTSAPPTAAGIAPGPSGGPALSAPPLPGNAPVGAPASPAAGSPAVSSAAPPLPGRVAPPLPPGAGAGPPLPPAAGPQYVMQASAQGASREELHALGWTDDALVKAGHMLIQ